jgi:hypothetical protein
VKQARTIAFDNEAVQALADPAHRKHRRVLAVIEAVAARNLRRAGSARLVVPTAIRVEAGWDKHDKRAAPINRLRIGDLPLDTAAADHAARVRAALAVSVADAHLAAVLGSTVGPHAVVTSDMQDVSRIAAHLDVAVNIVGV